MRSSLSSTDRALDSQLALSLIGRDAPHDLIVNRDFVTRIGNLCDVAFVRKLNISFNRIRSLDGIDQLPQLKQLLAYACDIDSIECIRSTPKIETVFLQQNKISKMGDTFNGLSKLLELRLDQNKIIKIEYLNSCVSLRKLDLSFNNIENLSGLNGLQQLQELKLSNNNIKTLSSLKSLPSMRDLDVSNNQIKSLDGIQNIPTLEYIRADHNLIAEVKLLPLIGSNKTKFANDNNGSSSKVGMDKKPSNTTSTGGSKKNSMTEVAALSGPMLSELSLTGNRIRSIHNLEIYKDTLELLDLSSNNLTATEINNIILTVQKCIKLTELRLYNNPICEDSAAMDKLILELSTACPALKAVDGLAIVANTDSKHSGQQARSTSLAEAYNAATAAASSRKGSTEFHTWNSSDSVAEDTINDANTTANEEEGEDDNLTGESDQSDNSDTELHNKKKKNMKNADNTIENNKQPPPNPYHLQLKEMLTIEQIQEKELLIRNKLQYCKEKLENATLSIFGFTNETAEVEVPKRQEKSVQKELKMSESGKRVSAVLQEKEGQLSRQLSGVVSVEDTIVVEEGVVVSATSTSMKESLVNRVRLAVSSSNSSRANSSSNIKESADTKQQQAPHSARSLPADDKSTPISMPTTTSSTTAARGIPGTLPNNPLLTDDLRASFELHRSLNNITSTTANNNSSSWSTARAEGKHESKSDSPTRSIPDKQQPLSPDSHSVASKLSTGTSKSKPFLPAKQSALSKGSAVLGSGLTRHGTKIKQRSTGAEAKGGDGAHSPIEASVALLRAAGTDVESLDMLNLKITKQAGYTYLTEPVEDVGDEGSDPDHQEEHREEEGEYTEVDGERDEYGLPLDSIEEEGGEGDEVAMLPPPKELLFHEVTTRSDDRFGRALGGFGAAGYDQGRVHRDTAEEMKSVEEIGRLRTPLAGTTDSLDVRSSGQKRLAEELARSMRRGHSAPNMDISEPSHLSITHEHSR